MVKYITYVLLTGAADKEFPFILHFIFCAEVLSLECRVIKNIIGTSIHCIEHTLPQFTDDAGILLDRTEQSLNETLTEVQNFANISGLNVNLC